MMVMTPAKATLKLIVVFTAMSYKGSHYRPVYQTGLGRICWINHLTRPWIDEPFRGIDQQFHIYTGCRIGDRDWWIDRHPNNKIAM